MNIKQMQKTKKWKEIYKQLKNVDIWVSRDKSISVKDLLASYRKYIDTSSTKS